MRDGWKGYLQESRHLFISHAKERILRELDAVDIESIEGTHSALDITCGIDYVITLCDGGEVGLASRMVKHRDYRNFAMKVGEWKKMCLAVDRDYLRPHYLAQGFFLGGKLASLALIEVEHLVGGFRKLRLGGWQPPVVWTTCGDKRLILIDWETLGQVEEFRIWDT